MHNVLKNLGLDDENPGAFSGEWHGSGAVHEKISPVDGKLLGKFRTASADDYEKVMTRALGGFREMARHARPGARRNRPPARQRPPRAKGRSRQTRLARVGQDSRRRRRRSAGDDRHLRLRGRPIAHALWPDDPIGAPEPSPDGAVASVRRDRRHLGVQFPGRGLVVERGFGGGLRRRHRLEAVGENSAHRHRRDQDRGACLSRDRRRSGDFHSPDRRPQSRRRTARG